MVDYCVGGSLAADDPTYVERSADCDLYRALVKAEFCYVLTARQMGKSSLRLRTRHHLEANGQGRCAAIDMTRIGSSQLTPEQWYQGLAFDLHRKFALQKVVQLSAWWQALGALSPVQKLSQFIETILLAQYPDEALYIFLDEIDSVRGLHFSVDDFFGLIRFCYNARAEDPRYRRLTWALFGVATPRDLVIDPQQAPFNIGQAIRLTGFSLAEAQPLADGLAGIAEQPIELLRSILAWTGGQPFLTQKLCALMRHHYSDRMIAAGTEVETVASIVNACLIDHWESQDDPEHLRTIRDRLLASPHDTNRLLGLHQRMLTEGSIAMDSSPEQAELKLAGIAVDVNGHLHIANRVYANVFGVAWVQHVLARQRPYADALNAWAASAYQDESRLLMGQALQEALRWSADKRLSDMDYRFLSASQEWDAKLIRLELDAQAKANQIMAEAQKKANQIIWLGYLSLGSCLLISLVALVISFVRNQ